MKRAGPVSCCLLLALIIALQAGCKKENAPAQNNPIVATNAALQAELDRVAGLPHEHDPATRPLVLSQPATNSRQWVVQALQRGYQDTARTNATWDSQVIRAFEAFADYSRVNTTNWPALQKALADVPPGCDDPMIQYMRIRYRDGSQSEDKTATEFLGVHEAMLRSKYHPAFKFLAGMRAVQSARAADKKTNRSKQIEWVTADLEDLARDTNAPVDEVFEAAMAWLNHSRAKDWIRFVTGNLEGILERNWGTTERWFCFRGYTELERAWGARGGGPASSVAEKGFQGFEEHLNKAEEFLTKAWQINSNNTQTAYMMMRLELGQGQSRSRMETWFQRAMALETNYYDAALLMSLYLEPRWYGSEAAALTFGRSCVASKKWGGQVPLVLVQLHHSLAKYYHMTNSAYWQRPQVWQDVKSSYEKFFALNPNEAGWRHDYAKDAYDCGQPAVFLQQTKLFAFGTNYAFFGGREKFQEMLEKAAASARGP